MGRIAQQPTANGGRYRPRTGRWRGSADGETGRWRGSADGETGRWRGSADGKTGRWRGPADGNARLIRRLGASRRLISRINA
jgi:hypothetical protein